MTTVIVVCVVSGALIVGAFWGLYGRLARRTEGFLVALAGGALIVSVVRELIEPATRHIPLTLAMGAVALGALVFTATDAWIERNFAGSGGGLLAAITLDGVPENLALGVTLIGAGPLQVAALSGSILLSNLPEAAGGARDMRASGYSRGKAAALWCATAVLLAAAALAGHWLLEGAPAAAIAGIEGFAAGAVVASLATEVFPEAFAEDKYLSGIAVAVGLILAFVLGSLG